MKNMIKILVLVSMTTLVYAQDVDKKYTSEEQEEIRKSLQEMGSSFKKANDVAIQSNESADAARNLLDSYDEQQKLKKEVEQLKENFEKVSKRADEIESNHTVGIVENSKDFANAYFEFNPFSILLIIFFAGSFLLGIFKFFTNRE